MTSFREQIRPKRGEIWAHVCENKATGLARSLYWSLDIECEPILWNGQPWDCGIQCEWLTWPVRHWVDLDGMTLGHVTRLSLIECWLYFADHHPVQLSGLAIRRIGTTTRFAVTLQGKFDLHGFGDFDESDIPVALTCELNFSGVIVVPENLAPKPADATQARAVVEPLLSTDELQPPRWDRFRYVLAPRLS